MDALWSKLADGIPAVVVAFIFLLIGIFVVLPIVRLLIDRLVPLMDRVVTVLEVHGRSSQQLADVLMETVRKDHELFENSLANAKREWQEQATMLQERIRELEAENKRLKEENNILKSEVETLRKQIGPDKEDGKAKAKAKGDGK